MCLFSPTFSSDFLLNRGFPERKKTHSWQLGHGCWFNGAEVWDWKLTWIPITIMSRPTDGLSHGRERPKRRVVCERLQHFGTGGEPPIETPIFQSQSPKVLKSQIFGIIIYYNSITFFMYPIIITVIIPYPISVFATQLTFGLRNA